MSCLDQLPKDAKFSLLSSVFTQSFFLWVGSGFSYNFGYGSWGNVLAKVSDKIEYPLVLDTKNPLRAAELLCSYAINEKGHDEYQFNSIVANSLFDLKEEVDDPDWTRRFHDFAPNIIVTTNWDNVLENIFDGLSNVIIRKDKSPQVSATGRNIFKLHGDVGRPNSIVVTQSQYFSFQREDTYLNRKIYTLFSEVSPVFIGYSLIDPNIRFIYEEVYAHLGEEKPPAFMVVHPDVSDHDFDESKLLFKNKNIFIIKAEIQEFLSDILDEFREYKKTTKRFHVEYTNIQTRLQDTFREISDKKLIKRADILNRFNTKESRHQAISAVVELLSNQILYKEFGGELLSPENRMSYREINQTISTVIWMSNEDGYPSYETKESFYESVMSLCAKSDGVWDFNTASKPFMNILRISPSLDSMFFEERIDHIIDVLRWSSPNIIGKCWSTWTVFSDKIDWFKENDIDEIVHEIRKSGRFPYRASDSKWLLKLKKSKWCTEAQKERIDDIVNDV